jgi:hypothetical protein
MVEIKALACELPARHGLPLAHWSLSELRRAAMEHGLVAQISGTTLRRWLSQDALRPWRHRYWIFPRDPSPWDRAITCCVPTRRPATQARRRKHPPLSPAPGRPIYVEHEYARAGACAYIAAWDVHRAKLFGRCERKTGIAPSAWSGKSCAKSRTAPPIACSGSRTTAPHIAAAAAPPPIVCGPNGQTSFSFTRLCAGTLTASGPSFRITTPKFPTTDPNHRILARQKSRFTHNYFYIRDEVLGPIVMRVATFFPFQTTYYLNGHSFIEQELNRAKIGFRKDDNAFLAVDDVAALQAAANKLSPAIIRERLDYWTLILGPKFSGKERKRINLSRFYSISQIEYCRNFIFKRNFPIHKLFERSCELGLWRLTSHKISDIFGQRLHRRISGKLATVIDQIEHGHHV